MKANSAATAKPAKVDPFDVPMIFLRIGWMTRYRGLAGDQIMGGGSFVDEHGFGHEIYNFQPHQGKVLGYVQTPRGAYNSDDAAGIQIRRLDPATTGKTVPGVLAVWLARHEKTSYIVGWYKNATVHRHWQPAPPGSKRMHGEVECGYLVSAAQEDAVLLRPHERRFEVPPKKRNGIGQAQIWYASDRKRHGDFRSSVLAYVNGWKLPHSKGGGGKQPDILRRQQIETAAVLATTKHFEEQLYYKVTNVSKDNVGWDLNAVSRHRLLRLEVKGLSGSSIVVDLTPNEYAMMQKHRDSYLVCVLTNALEASQKLSVFGFSPDSGCWEDEHGRQLEIEPITAARCSAE
jgi:hypothetical protein